jgi:hypothetical protein
MEYTDPQRLSVDSFCLDFGEWPPFLDLLPAIMLFLVANGLKVRIAQPALPIAFSERTERITLKTPMLQATSTDPCIWNAL